MCPGNDLAGIFQPKLVCDTYFGGQLFGKTQMFVEQGRVKAISGNGLGGTLSKQHLLCTSESYWYHNERGGDLTEKSEELNGSGRFSAHDWRLSHNPNLQVMFPALCSPLCCVLSGKHFAGM